MLPATSPGPLELPRAERLEARFPRWVHAGPPTLHAVSWALIGALLLLAATLVHLGAGAGPLEPLLQHALACPLRSATSVPGPGCGTTHALALLAHGAPLAALYASPLAALSALVLWLHTLLTAARLAGLRRTLWLPTPPAGVARNLRLGAAAALVANWAFVILVSRGGAP